MTEITRKKKHKNYDKNLKNLLKIYQENEQSS